MRRFVLALSLLVTACGSDPATPATEAPRAPELGVNGSATVVEFLAEALKQPRDLAFNPLRPDELWVLSMDGSVAIVHQTTGEATVEVRRDAAADHFLHKPSSIAFGADGTTFGAVGTFGTCGESRNEHGIEGAEDFMGPVLWTSDLEIFARKNPIGLGSHLDMLHNSPLCMGIAHEQGNTYWTINGRDNSIVKYDFAADHDVGMDDHTDGASLEYVRGQLKYAPGIPSHMVYRAADAMLYVADTGNGRVVKLDTKSGVQGIRLPTKEKQTGGHYRMDDAVLTDVVPPGVLVAPSGLELHNDVLYVTDNATGRIVAFDLNGQQINALETGLAPGALAGMTFGPDGKIYFVDMLGSRVMRIDPS